MAGQIPGFDENAVRAGLRLAMTVGLPPVKEDQPTFFFKRAVTNEARADEHDVPFDVTARRTFAAPRKVQVPCAVEYFDNAGKLENFGVMVPTKVELTLLDQEYAKVKGFEFVVIGGNRFFYQRTQPPIGLATVGVFIIHCTAEDNS